MCWPWPATSSASSLSWLMVTGWMSSLTALSRPSLLGDPDRLRQVVSNLVANAIRHTPTGTCVTVSVNVVADDVLLEVSDDGPGMGEESAARAFERFYRADSARSREGDVSGSGLGLAIVQAIAQAHGGRATIRSEPGVGTVVSVRLPRLAA